MTFRSDHTGAPDASIAGRPEMEVVELLREVVEKGLIYWAPVTERGAAAKADMLYRCETFLGAQSSTPAEPAPQATFQARVDDWVTACFGDVIRGDKVERNHRFIEEALELVQSAGCTQSEAHQLVDYVYGRPAGDLAQEIGGVMNTLAALCNIQGVDMMQAGDTELARCWTKIEKIRAKQAAKPKHSPLPEALSPSTQPDADQVLRGVPSTEAAEEPGRGVAALMTPGSSHEAAVQAEALADPSDEEIISAIRRHSSPTLGSGDIHGGQRGLILYEPYEGFVVAALRKLFARTPPQDRDRSCV